MFLVVIILFLIVGSIGITKVLPERFNNKIISAFWLLVGIYNFWTYLNLMIGISCIIAGLLFLRISKWTCPVIFILLLFFLFFYFSTLFQKGDNSGFQMMGMLFFFPHALVSTISIIFLIPKLKGYYFKGR